MKTAIQHLKISSARFHNFAFYLLTFYFLKLFNQFESIMQNKPNLPDAQMNVTSFITTDYLNKCLRQPPKNEPNTNPIRTQFKPNTKPKQTQSNPISRQSSINHSFFQMNSNHCDVSRGNTTYSRSLSKGTGPKG